MLNTQTIGYILEKKKVVQILIALKKYYFNKKILLDGERKMIHYILNVPKMTIEIISTTFLNNHKFILEYFYQKNQEQIKMSAKTISPFDTT